jgi:DNA-binding transcriptional LysR family regulator
VFYGIASRADLRKGGGPSGALSGTLEDSSHAVIANAEVDIISAATGELVRTLSTNAAGLFTATLLPVGIYTETIEAAKRMVQRGLGLTFIPRFAVDSRAHSGSDRNC